MFHANLYYLQEGRETFAVTPPEHARTEGDRRNIQEEMDLTELLYRTFLFLSDK